MTKIIITILVLFLLLVCYCSFYVITRGKQKWLSIFTTTVVISIIISCFLSLYKITNIVVVYLTNKYVIFVSIIIWAFVLAMIMDKIKEPKDNKAKKT
ncbi:hypothetical protein II582_02735 [bacterium]|nr:hypothetical protein [bacterium]